MRLKLKRGNEEVWDYISDRAHILIVTDCLATERRVSLICRGFQFLFYILELRANFTVRRHILQFFLFYCRLEYEERERSEEKKEKDG